MHLEYFQMIDEVLAVGDDTIEARATVPEKSPVFEGHFPGHPLVPGVLLVETMAQASGFLIMANNGFAAMPFLVGVRDAKLRTFVEPGTVLDIEASIDHHGSGFAMTKAAVKASGRRICNASLTFKTMDFPSEDLAAMIRDRARETGIPEDIMTGV